MAANLSTHLIIQAYQTRSGNTDRTQVIPEANGQTFLQGSPLTLVSGYVTAWTTPVPSGTPPGNTTGLVGFAKQNGQNLSGTVGASAPAQPFGSVPQPGTAYTFGNPQLSHLLYLLQKVLRSVMGVLCSRKQMQTLSLLVSLTIIPVLTTLQHKQC